MGPNSVGSQPRAAYAADTAQPTRRGRHGVADMARPTRCGRHGAADTAWPTRCSRHGSARVFGSTVNSTFRYCIFIASEASQLMQSMVSFSRKEKRYIVHQFGPVGATCNAQT